MRDGNVYGKKQKRRRDVDIDGAMVAAEGVLPGLDPPHRAARWEQRTRVLFSPEAQPFPYLRTESQGRCLGLQLSDYTQATLVLMNHDNALRDGGRVWGKPRRSKSAVADCPGIACSR